MPAPAPAAAMPGFTDEQLAELLVLLKDSDSVELKLTVPEPHMRSTVVALGMDPLQAQLRQVVFFDTPELTLDKHGVVVRARRIQDKGDDSAVKLRPVVPTELPAKLRRSAAFRVEVDALPGGFVCSGALKGTPQPADVLAVMAGEKKVHKLFSKEQRAFFSDHAPEGVGLDDLAVLGPILIGKLRFAPPELKRKLVAEMWLFPDGSRVLELSTRCTTADAFQAAAETRAFLGSRGIDLSGEQQTKTRKALEFFADAARRHEIA
jgi:hypothetical protein